MLVRVEARHIALLRAMKVMWLPIEAGFPFVDVLEPYGSTDIAGDVERILGHSIPGPIDVHNADGGVVVGDASTIDLG